MTKAYKALPPASELWEMFDYKPLTGELVWNNHPRYKAWKGRVAGVIDKNYGYVVVTCNRERYKAHRLVWSWVTGKELNTTQRLDHVDRTKNNNCFHNLRFATAQQQAYNRNPNAKGYFVSKGPANRKNPYQAVAVIDGVQTFLGSYKTAKEANERYKLVRKEIAGEFFPYSETT
jgi:hypothetical protein